MMTPATPTIIRTGDQQGATGMNNRRLVPMPTKESRRREAPTASASWPLPALQSWHCFAFLIVAATIWYAAKGPLIVIGLLAGFFWSLNWLCSRFPKTIATCGPQGGSPVGIS